MSVCTLYTHGHWDIDNGGAVAASWLLPIYFSIERICFYEFVYSFFSFAKLLIFSSRVKNAWERSIAQASVEEYAYFNCINLWIKDCRTIDATVCYRFESFILLCATWDWASLRFGPHIQHWLVYVKTSSDFVCASFWNLKHLLSAAAGLPVRSCLNTPSRSCGRIEILIIIYGFSSRPEQWIAASAMHYTWLATIACVCACVGVCP